MMRRWLRSELMTECVEQEPLKEVQIDGSKVTLLGTAHVSRVSAEKVEALLESGQYDAVAVELCPSR